MIKVLVYVRSVVRYRSLRGTSRAMLSECLEHGTRTVTVDYRKQRRDPTGGERLRVFCRDGLGSVDGGGLWFEIITVELAAWDDTCWLVLSTKCARVQDRHRSSANMLPGLSRPHAGRGLGWRLHTSVERALEHPIR